MIKFWHKVITAIFGLGLIGIGAVDLAIQTKPEVTDIIIIKQEQCIKDTGKYCQFRKGEVIDTKIRQHDYGVVVDVWQGGKGDLHNQQGYRIRYIEPVIPYVDMGTTT